MDQWGRRAWPSLIPRAPLLLSVAAHWSDRAHTEFTQAAPAPQARLFPCPHRPPHSALFVSIKRNPFAPLFISLLTLIGLPLHEVQAEMARWRLTPTDGA